MTPLELLKNPKLLDIIVKITQMMGVVGEKTPIKAVTLICAGKLVKNKETTSTNLHIEDESGAGKDHLLKMVMKIIFNQDWIKYNTPTPTAISYGQQKERLDGGSKDKNGNKIVEWKTVDKEITENSIVYIKDASEDFINGNDCKLLLEEENVNLSKTILQKNIHLKWKKPVVIITTADTVTSNQLLRRLPSVHLNTSDEQTEEINKYQLDRDCDIAYKKKTNDIGKINVVEEVFYLLNPVFVDLSKVKNDIEKQMPKYKNLIMRTLFPRLLDLIKFSTALHQHQRESYSDMHIYANEQDVKIGFDVFNYIYKEGFIDVTLLNARQRKIYNRLKCDSGEWFTVSQIHDWKETGGITKQQLYEDMRVIRRTDSNIKLNEDNRPKKYSYDGYKVRPVTEQEEEVTEHDV